MLRILTKITSKIVNSIFLLIVYIIGVGLTSIASKIIGKSFLDTKLSKTKKTYWSSHKASKNHYRQF